MNNSIKFFLLLPLIFASIFCTAQYDSAVDFTDPLVVKETFDNLTTLLNGKETESEESLKYLEKTWVDSYIPMLLDVIYWSREEVDVSPVVKLLEKQTNQKFGRDIPGWLQWLWNKDIEVLPFYGDWMAKIYKNLDPKFEQYFLGRTSSATIRLDEVRWGGVVQDGIPPLRKPKMLEANEGRYLSNSDVVFGVSINGDHRAYPKRILAWHEMFVDEIGGESIAGVYCTLCGTVIAYNTKFNGKNYALGTSGFLYRSNKLMYDRATQSLWNTIEGKPVIGSLASSDIELSSHSVVTTTWGAWKKLHPDTKVLSLETGHNRNYDEGNAYREYFATDRLMFNVPKLDNRLSNKEEVLIVRAEGYQEDPLAISAKYLNKNKIYHDKIGNTNFVVLTNRSGGNRVYASEGIIFDKIKGNIVTDVDGKSWKITEEKLTSNDGEKLNSLPYHRIFWFAWFNTYENTRLVD